MSDETSTTEPAADPTTLAEMTADLVAAYVTKTTSARPSCLT